jgi:DNA-directed RNA polymerase subunit RPC12/RpoP
MYICASCCASRAETALVVEARESGLEGPCCEREACVRCLAAMVFMMVLELLLLLLLLSERVADASADWTGCERLMSTIASCSSEMVTGTAQADQMSYLCETASRQVSKDQEGAVLWCRAAARRSRRVEVRGRG